MREKAEIVIVGAGVIGCSIAYFLSKKGYSDIVVIDKGGISSGITGICPGGVRQQWGTEINCLMAKASTEFYQRINDELEPEYEIKFRQVGYLYLFHSEQAAKNYQPSLELQNRLGIPTKFITRDEVKEIVPGVNTDTFLSASYCPTDGFADDAYHVTTSFAAAAKRRGVRFILDEVPQILVENNRVVGVQTGRGRIDCSFVVNAAGLGSKELAATIGVEIPIQPEVRRILYTNRIEERILEPLLISFERGFAAKQLTDGTIYLSYLGSDMKPPYNSFDYQMKAAEVGMELFPPLEQVEFRTHVDGTYDSTPDHQAILGGVDEVAGYYQAIGMSGHGFMMAPAIGETIADTIIGNKTSVDISPLHFNRFRQNALIPEPRVV